MSSRRFLVPAESLKGEVVKLPDDEAMHARKVLRLKRGDAVQLVDGMGNKALANISSINRHEVLCEVLERHEQSNPKLKLVICPGLLKGPAMDPFGRQAHRTHGG